MIRKRQEETQMMKRFLDFMAAMCLCFNVDWDEDFPDDEYCLENRNRAVRPEIVRAPAAEMPKAS